MSEGSSEQLNCTNCGRSIRLGQARVPTDDGVAHAKCVVERVSKVEYRDGSMRTDDLALALEGGDALPGWMVRAEQHHSLREGPVGVLERMRDGSVRFRTGGRYERV